MDPTELPPLTTRSRGGCSQCKRRKRKCDETWPKCRACQKRNIQCDGYNTPLRWANGIASRGRFAGATTPSLAVFGTPGSSSKAISPAPPVSSYSNSTTTDNQQPHGDQVFSSSMDATEHPLGFSSLASSPTNGISISKQHHLFERFIHGGMNKLFLSGGKKWPEDHFSAMARESQAFFVVCGAIQAYFDDGDSVSTMEHFDYALQTFRSELHYRHETFDVSTFSAGLLLCSLCLFQGRTWTMFLERMYVLYRLETTMNHLLPEADHDVAIQHSIEVISIMDMESMVIGRVSPSMEIWHRLRKVQEGWIGGRPGGIEIVSGIPRTLLDVIADIGRYDAQEVESRLWAWPGDIGQTTECLLWDCWRYTAVLDVRRIERNRRKKQTTLNIKQHEPGTGTTTSFPSREIVMCRLASAIYALYRLVTLPENDRDPLYHRLLYPIIIGSLEVPLLHANPDWQCVFQEIRAESLEKETFRCIRLVDEILDEAWKEGTDTFDIEEAARTRGIEIAVY